MSPTLTCPALCLAYPALPHRTPPCHTQAALAHVAGNVALAAALADRGCWHGEQMKAAHMHLSSAVQQHMQRAAAARAWPPAHAGGSLGGQEQALGGFGGVQARAEHAA